MDLESEKFLKGDKMGWDKLADLGAGLFKRFWSKEAKEESRDNEITKLEKEQLEKSKNNPDGKHDKRLSVISERLSRLYEDSKNAR